MGTGWDAKGVYDNLLFVTVANIAWNNQLQRRKGLLSTQFFSFCLVNLVVFGPVVRQRIVVGGEDKEASARAIAPGLGAFQMVSVPVCYSHSNL